MERPPSCSPWTSGCDFPPGSTKLSPPPPPTGMWLVAIPGTHLHQCSGQRAGANEQLGWPGPLLPSGPSEWVPVWPVLPQGIWRLAWWRAAPGLSLGPWCSGRGDMTLSPDSDRADPRPHAHGGSVAVTREKEIAPYLVCSSLLRTTGFPCGEAFWAHSASPVLSRDCVGGVLCPGHGVTWGHLPPEPGPSSSRLTSSLFPTGSLGSFPLLSVGQSEISCQPPLDSGDLSAS